MKKSLAILAIVLLCLSSAYALEEVIYYCPKCGSESVKVFSTWKPPKPTITRKSIDELPYNPPMVTTLEIKYYPMRGVCKSCGYTRDFMTPQPSFEFEGRVTRNKAIIDRFFDTDAFEKDLDDTLQKGHFK
jgi:predicted nucleic-acid-binding Zn-ribbon protein